MKITIATLTDEPFLIEVNEDLEIDNLKSLCEEYVAIPKTEMQILHDGVPLMHETKTLRGYGIQENDILVVQRMRGQQQQRGTSQGNQALAGRPSAPRPAVPAAAAAAAASGQGMLPVIDFSNIQVPGALGALQPMVGSSLASSTQRRPSIPSSGAQGAGAAAAAASTDHRFVEEALALRNRLLGMPHEIALLRERNPQLAEALMSGIPDRFVEVLRRQREQMSRQQMERIRMLNSDPFDSDVQRRIAEEIQQRNVDDNMESAIEFMPEAFGHVVMLYINCNVNGHNVKAFVDSGAQMTIMSQACAVRCGIMRLVDTRWAGIAKGVGTQKIIGRVHLSQIKIENAFLNSSFAILEEQPMDMLLGLDMLRRHQCCIDLTRNILTIGTTGTETSFLPESELPEHARLHQSDWVTGGDAAPDDDGQMAIAMERSHDEAQKRTHNAAESTSAGVGLSESAIAQLTQMGFSRESVVQELRQAGGDVDQALAALLAQSNAEGMF